MILFLTLTLTLSDWLTFSRCQPEPQTRVIIASQQTLSISETLLSYRCTYLHFFLLNRASKVIIIAKSKLLIRDNSRFVCVFVFFIQF